MTVTAGQPSCTVEAAAQNTLGRPTAVQYQYSGKLSQYSGHFQKHSNVWGISLPNSQAAHHIHLLLSEGATERSNTQTASCFHSNRPLTCFITNLFSGLFSLFIPATSTVPNAPGCRRWRTCGAQSASNQPAYRHTNPAGHLGNHLVFLHGEAGPAWSLRRRQRRGRGTGCAALRGRAVGLSCVTIPAPPFPPKLRRWRLAPLTAWAGRSTSAVSFIYFFFERCLPGWGFPVKTGRTPPRLPFGIKK